MTHSLQFPVREHTAIPCLISRHYRRWYILTGIELSPRTQMNGAWQMRIPLLWMSSLIRKHEFYLLPSFRTEYVLWLWHRIDDFHIPITNRTERIYRGERYLYASSHKVSQNRKSPVNIGLVRKLVFGYPKTQKRKKDTSFLPRLGKNSLEPPPCVARQQVESLRISLQLIYTDHQVVIPGQNRHLYNIYGCSGLLHEDNEPS